MRLKIKRLDSTISLPAYGTDEAAGFDLAAAHDVTIAPRRIGCADIDPDLDHAGQIAHRNDRLFRFRHAARKFDAFREFKQVGQDPRDQVFI